MSPSEAPAEAPDLRWARVCEQDDLWAAYWFRPNCIEPHEVPTQAWVRRLAHDHFMWGLGAPDSAIGTLGRAHSLDDAIANATERLLGLSRP